jgi:isoamylase
MSTLPSPIRESYLFRDIPLSVARGAALPLGARRTPNGVNFALISRNAQAVWLVLMEPCSSNVEAEIPLDPVYFRTGYHWHIRISGLPEEFCYGYRVAGPSGNRHRFNPECILLDPVVRALSCGRPWGNQGTLPRRSLMTTRISEEIDPVAPPAPMIPREDSILYELHVRGYTVHNSSGVRPSRAGTFAGLIDKISHVKDLGITAVEILPIDEFDEMDCRFVDPVSGERLRNFWGYNTIAFGAPKASYSTNPEGSAPLVESRRMIGALHSAGMEVILDVVFNHTAEGGDDGPTYSFRGLDNSLYYLLDSHGRYLNYTGCGNTINSNHPIVRGMMLNRLRAALAESGVDGFRFDLASVLGRDKDGNVLVEPPVIEMISEDALLADAKLIAEPWDAAGLYQVGTFPGGPRWSVWNGQYRDDVRRFWKGDPGMTSPLATRLCGSDDLYHGRTPLHSINFITCHDGFTLNDLVTYEHKRNERNGEGNRDGADVNWSWNCGVEGPTDDPAILSLRHRQARNLIATLLVSQGVPMLLAGDEFLRTQGGNNNAWCQDNETSWVDWKLAERNADFLRFVRQMIALRKRHAALRRRTFFSGGIGGKPPEISWHGVQPGRPDFSFDSHSIALVLDGRGCDRPGVVDRDFYMVFNAFRESLDFAVPASPTGRRWRRTVDTSLGSPNDALGLDEGPVVALGTIYRVEAHSMLILVSEA